MRSHHKSFILMDFVDYPHKQEFQKHIINFLTKNCIRAPKIILQSTKHHLSLIEDLGTVNMMRYLNHHHEQTWHIHKSFIDMMRGCENGEINFNIPDFFPTMTNVHFKAFFEYWVKKKIANKGQFFEAKEDFMHMVENEYMLFNNFKAEFVHGDINSKHIIIINPKIGSEEIGVISLFNAFIGPQMYNIIPLCEDICNMDNSELIAKIKEYYLNLHGNTNSLYYNQAWALLSVHYNIYKIGEIAYINQNPALKKCELLEKYISRLSFNLKNPYVLKFKKWFEQHKLLDYRAADC